jgi:hypothetical protein
LISSCPPTEAGEEMKYRFIVSITYLYLSMAGAALTTWAMHNAFAGQAWNCKLTNQAITCKSGGQDPAEKIALDKKMGDAIEMLKGTRCRITEFDSSGEIETNQSTMVASVSIYVVYACATEDQEAREQWRRIGESGHKIYQLDCIKSHFKYYARGFDTYMDGRKMHWDSLTERVPWKPINEQPANTEVYRIFAILCR